MMADKLLTIEQLLALLDKYNHRELHMHHTWKPNHSSFNGSNYQKIQDGMRNSHIKDRGFIDIAQHVSLFPDGMFMTGRAFNVNPASITGQNYDLPFCLEIIGDFDIGKDKFTGKQKEAALKLAKYFDDKKKYVRFHNENSQKSCPGTSIVKSVFMAEVRALNAKPTSKPAPKPVVKPAPKKEESVQILTGGLNSTSAKEITEYFIAKKWWGQLQFEAPDNPRMLSGGLSPSMRTDYEAYLKKKNWFYEVLKK